MAQCTCEKCGRTKAENKFYTYKDGTKVELCKDCITMHIDNFDPSTFLWILEKLDLPYVPEEWNVLRDRAFAKNPNLTGMSVIGKYISKMKLKQFKEYGWADSEMLQALNAEKIGAGQAEAKKEFTQEQRDFLKSQLDNGEITEAQYKTLMPVEVQNENLELIDPVTLAGGANQFFSEGDFASDLDIPDPAAELTDEDKIYLAVKWGRLYKPNEWIELEKSYQEMMESFDIQDADSKNSLVFICKTKLKMNQAIDCGDIDGFNKLSRTYETLRKSSKFNAASNKNEKDSEFVDSVGELVAFCEKNGGIIPRHKIEDVDKDIVDKIIDDLKQYNKSLIYEDTALAQEIEDYIKKREAADRRRADKEEAKAQGLEHVELNDEDYKEYYNKIELEREADQKLMEGSDNESS